MKYESTIFYNAKILTMDNKNTIFQAILIKKNKIIALGENEEILQQKGNNCRIIDLKNAIVLPAFIDSHTHFFEYARWHFEVNLNSANSVSEIKKMLFSFKKNLKSQRIMIGGSGWDLNKYKDAEMLDINLLDEVFPDTPVRLHSRDFHTSLCNSQALKIAGVDKNTISPEGGAIGHFSNGELNGFFMKMRGIY